MNKSFFILIILIGFQVFEIVHADQSFIDKHKQNYFELNFEESIEENSKDFCQFLFEKLKIAFWPTNSIQQVNLVTLIDFTAPANSLFLFSSIHVSRGPPIFI